jgi:hypothetical protein
MVVPSISRRSLPSWRSGQPLKAHSKEACEASDLAEYGLGGTTGSRGGLPARSRPSAGCQTMLIPLGAAVDRTQTIRIDFAPCPIPAVILQGIVYSLLGWATMPPPFPAALPESFAGLHWQERCRPASPVVSV